MLIFLTCPGPAFANYKNVPPVMGLFHGAAGGPVLVLTRVVLAPFSLPLHGYGKPTQSYKATHGYGGCDLGFHSPSPRMPLSFSGAKRETV